ncbi:aldo/keto reductase [Mesorhizobium sp. B3-1-6]|uniref:aldo/keto reductase n=1 Tax=Mesorhizobium sp. B3-1-6 TaxID=2589895 RepID=UPI0011283CFB|nr:aldo/keto reductase [Mesorhizobium sp. B3-1-6]TPI41354.1 aldo/keto reductase [Mesorhizobium sp. B3-1-6]
MEMRSLGPGGPKVSLVGLGCNNFGWRIDRDATRKVIDAAVDCGINFFDTADIYGKSQSEQLIGELLGSRRKDIVLATKFGKGPGAVAGVRGTRAYIRQAAAASLKRLRTDWIDVYYMHEPDPGTPIDDTLGALDELVQEGKVRAIAASNFSVADINGATASAKRNGTAAFIASQEEYRLTERRIEKDVLPNLDRLGLGLVPFFPLGGGALTGKYRRDQAMPQGTRLTEVEIRGQNRFLDPHWDHIEALKSFAETRGRTLVELALCWLAQRPRVASIIAGATRPEQVEANAHAAGWKLTPAEMAEVDTIVPGPAVAA